MATPKLEKVPEKTDALSFYTFLLLLVGALVFSFFMIEPFVPPIIMGGIFAVLFLPIQDFLIKKKWNARISAALIVLFIIVIVTGPFSFFISRVIVQGITFGQQLASGKDFSPDAILEKLMDNSLVRMLGSDPQELEQKARMALQSGGRWISEVLLAQAANIPDLLLHSIISLITCFVFLVSGRKLVAWFSDKIPIDKDVRTRLMNSFRSSSKSVIWAALAAASSQSVVMLIAFLVLNVPLAFFAAGATLLCSWIPLVGASPVWIAGAIYLYTQQRISFAVAMVVFGLIAGIVDNIVRPLMLKGKGEMHPVVSLIAVFGGLRIFGALGIFFGPIIAALVISLLQVWPAVRLRFTNQN